MAFHADPFLFGYFLQPTQRATHLRSGLVKIFFFNELFPDGPRVHTLRALCELSNLNLSVRSSFFNFKFANLSESAESDHPR